MRRTHSALAPRRTRGLALVLTLWLVVLLTAMVYTLLLDVQVEVRLRGLSADSVEAHWLARAGLAKAIADLSNDLVIERSEDNQQLDALGDVWAFDNEDKIGIALSDQDDAGVFSVRVMDAESRININTASLDLLKNLFIVLGEDDEITAQHRAEAIIDWRDENTDPVSATAEPGFQETRHWEQLISEENYQDDAAHWTGAFHNGRFVTVEELLMVPMITPEIHHGAEAEEGRRDRGRGERGERTPGLADCVTVLSNGQININTAPREVLGALALTALGSATDWESVADAIIEQRDGNNLDDPDDDTPFVNVNDLQNIPMAAGIATGQGLPRLTTRSQNFVITSTGYAGSARHTIVCEVRRSWETYLRPALQRQTQAVLAQVTHQPMEVFLTDDDEQARATRNRDRVRRSTRTEENIVEMPAVRTLSWVEN